MPDDSLRGTEIDISFSHAETLVSSVQYAGSSLTILLIYRPPSNSVVCFLDELHDVLLFLEAADQLCLVGEHRGATSATPTTKERQEPGRRCSRWRAVYVDQLTGASALITYERLFRSVPVATFSCSVSPTATGECCSSSRVHCLLKTCLTWWMQ